MNASLLWALPASVDAPIPAESKWDMIRRYRNELLTRCDWTQLTDAPLTLEEKQVWSSYRQELRDVPDNFLLPDEVVFPAAPDAEQA
jgi:hypothetical protein